MAQGVGPWVSPDALPRPISSEWLRRERVALRWLSWLRTASPPRPVEPTCVLPTFWMPRRACSSWRPFLDAWISCSQKLGAFSSISW